MGGILFKERDLVNKLDLMIEFKGMRGMGFLSKIVIWLFYFNLVFLGDILERKELSEDRKNSNYLGFKIY